MSLISTLKYGKRNNYEYAQNINVLWGCMYEIVIVLLCISLAIDPQSQVQRPDRILPWPTEYSLCWKEKHVLLSLIVPKKSSSVSWKLIPCLFVELFADDDWEMPGGALQLELTAPEDFEISCNLTI